jgi:hypothetical protein
VIRTVLERCALAVAFGIGLAILAAAIALLLHTTPPAELERARQMHADD